MNFVPRACLGLLTTIALVFSLVAGSCFADDTYISFNNSPPKLPATLKAYGKIADLTTLENPIRKRILSRYREEPGNALKDHALALERGQIIYYLQCYYCHGALFDGNGPHAEGLDPKPTNFRAPGAIENKREAYLYWRTVTGSTGLADHHKLINSAMPAFVRRRPLEGDLEKVVERDIWDTLIYISDYVKQVPLIKDKKLAETAKEFQSKLNSIRVESTPKELYDRLCLICHGAEGRVDQDAAHIIYPVPRDFTYGIFKYKTTKSDLPPSDEDIYHVIKNGLPNTDMPGYGSILTDKQIYSLIDVIKSMDTRRVWAPQNVSDQDFNEDGRYKKEDFISVKSVEPVDQQVPYSNDSLKRGKLLYGTYCAHCHGNEGRGDSPSGMALGTVWGVRVWPRDLTQPATWGVSYVEGDDAESRDLTIQKIYQRVTLGIPGTPMVPYGEIISKSDRWHLANYTFSLHAQHRCPEESGSIKGYYVESPLPTNVDDALWRNAACTTLKLTGNFDWGERLTRPMNETISVRVLFNRDEIAFLLEINDRTESRPGKTEAEAVQEHIFPMFSDAFAVQFPRQGAGKSNASNVPPHYRHGDEDKATIIWYWNAGAIAPKQLPKSRVLAGKGTDAPLSDQSGNSGLVTDGQWLNGKWKVMIRSPIRLLDEHGLNNADDMSLPVSFANWEGSNGEHGGKHTLTRWYNLSLSKTKNH